MRALQQTLISWVILLAAALAGAEPDAATTATSPADLPFRVLRQRRFEMGDHRVIVNRVVPPFLPSERVRPLATPAGVLSPEAEKVKQQAAKKAVVLMISVTVYDREVSELRWADESGWHRAWSNIDFHYFTGVGGFETADTSYSLMLGLGDESRAQVVAFNRSITSPEAVEGMMPMRVPPLLADFSSTRSEYIVMPDAGQAATTAASFPALDALHAYFDANKPRLIAEYTQRTAAQATRQRWLKAHPPVVKDTVINFWPADAQQLRQAKEEAR